MLEPPVPVTPDKLNLMSPAARRVVESRCGRPRVSLRWFASYQTLGYFMVMYGFLYLWRGSSLLEYCLLMLLVSLVYCVMRATVSQPSHATLWHESVCVAQFITWVALIWSHKIARRATLVVFLLLSYFVIWARPSICLKVSEGPGPGLFCRNFYNCTICPHIPLPYFRTLSLRHPFPPHPSPAILSLPYTSPPLPSPPSWGPTP